MILAVDPPEFLSAKLDRIHFVFAQYFKSVLRDVGDKVAHSVNAYHGSGDLFFRGFNLAIDHLFKGGHRYTEVGDGNTTGKFYSGGGKDVTLGKCSTHGINGIQLYQLLVRLLADQPEEAIITPYKEMILQLHSNKSISPVPGSVYAYQVNGAFGEIPEHSTQDKGRMGNI